MNQLESTKQINRLKLNCIKNGGYKKHAEILLKACKIHYQKYGTDYTPFQLKSKKI